MNKEANAKYTITIVEDSRIHAEWLNAELSDNNFSVLNIYQYGKEAILAIKASTPDLVILDFQLKDITGLEVAKKIKLFNSAIKIFMLTAHTEISIINRIITDKNIDALGIKSSPYFESNLISAILHICDGGTYLDPSLLGKLRESSSETNLTALTQREFEIFIQLNIGKSEEQISHYLNIELASVRNLNSKIAKKINRTKLAPLVSKLVKNAEK